MLVVVVHQVRGKWNLLYILLSPMDPVSLRVVRETALSALACKCIYSKTICSVCLALNSCKWS